MNFKLAWVLLAILFVAVSVLLVATLVDDSPDTGEALLKPLTGVKEDEVDAVEIVRTQPTEEKLVLTKAGKGWEVTEPGRGKADPLAVRKLVADVLAAKPTASKDVTDNKAVHGLNNPGITVTLKAGAKSATLNVGDTTIGQNPLTFVTTGTRPDRPVAVLRRDLDGLFRADPVPGREDRSGPAWQTAKWASDYRQRAFFQGEADLMADVESITVAQGGREAKLVRNTGTGEWTFAAPPGYGQADLEGDPQAPPGTFTGVRPLINAITALQAVSADDFVEKPESLDKYGLAPTDKDVLRIEVKPKAGPAGVLYVGKRTDDKSDKYYCKLASDGVVVKATAVPERIAAFGKVAADPTLLRDRTPIPSAKQPTIDAIDVVVGPTTTRLRRIPAASGSPRWVLYGGPGDPQAAAPVVTGLLNTLSQPRLAKEVLTAPYDAVFADAEKKAEIRLWYDGTDLVPPTADPTKLPPEPKLKGDGKPAVTLVVGKKEADSVYVRRITADGIRTDMKLPESVLATLTRGRLDYVDATFKPFPPRVVKKLTLARGPETVVVEGDGKTPTAWAFTAPERLKGQAADAGKVEEFVGLLRIMTPVRTLAEAEAEWPKFGVAATPRLRAVVTFDPATEPERAYEFGNDLEGNLVALRTSGRPLVTAVSSLFFTRLMTEDLRDRQLYRLDPKSVKAVELTGWKQALGKPTKYRFELAGTAWTLKEPAGGTVDPAKMEIFLAALAAPRAASYIPGGFTPDRGLDLANAANALEVRLETAGPAVALTIGNETDGGANYFAWTSAKKDDVVTLSTAALREFKDKPQAFLK